MTHDELAAHLTWLAKVCGSLRVFERDEVRVVQVTVDPDEDTVVIVKRILGADAAAVGVICEALSEALHQVDHHRRQQTLRLVPEVTT